VPVGNGTLLIGVELGIKSLMAGGVLDRPPCIIAVQAAGCAPIHRAFVEGKAEVAPVANNGTAAEGIAIAAPMRGSQLLSALKRLGGTIVAVDEEAIARASNALTKAGIFVEPTSAATLAGAENWAKTAGFTGDIAVPMCGAGLKSLH